MKRLKTDPLRRRALSKLNGLILLIGLLVVACGQTGLVFSEYEHIPSRGWDKRNILRFTPEIADTTMTYDISVLLRYSSEYAYNNLWLFVSYPAENGEMRTDTLDCRLADEFGKWYGSGWGASYQQEIPFKTAFVFPRKGKQTIQIQQGMRDDVIGEVSDVGIKIRQQGER